MVEAKGLGNSTTLVRAEVFEFLLQAFVAKKLEEMQRIQEVPGFVLALPRGFLPPTWQELLRERELLQAERSSLGAGNVAPRT